MAPAPPHALDWWRKNVSHRVVYESRIARAVLPERFAAFVFGRTIYVRGQEMSEATYLHELCHVCQFARYGLFGFLARYLWWQVVRGYERNPIEVEARLFAARHLRRER